ncbi:MAG: tRNA pseudouridine(55) synthase TruB [Acidobacteria bacterium]|nr:tRNA pseudouridine(55) synthase TruB [Acidobacteriota bacterium]
MPAPTDPAAGRGRAGMTAGVLVVDKPQGPTSHDVVAVARRALGERRIGHCGTLDPLATGVLALAIGQATRLVQYLMATDKTYQATVRFGVVTTTYDTLGEVCSRSDVRPTRDAIAQALDQFRGSQLQTPPVFSAKKIDGHRSYDLARRTGQPPPALAPVAVQVHALTLDAFDGECAVLTMTVSSGFYVRSLAHDLGQMLGTGAALQQLRRTRVGSFSLDQAVTLDTLATVDRHTVQARVIPMTSLMTDRPALHLDGPTAARARKGVDLPCPSPDSVPPSLTRLFDDEGRLLGLAVPARQPGFLHPTVVFGWAPHRRFDYN